MADPVFLIENYFSSSQFSTHVVSAIQEAAGKQAFRVGDGRRIQLDHWSSTSLNVEAWIKVDCVSTKSATGIALDRGHNLAGKSVVLERSANDSGWTNVFTATIPATAATDGDIDDANGITTDEGAWLKRFASVSDRYWRLRIPAMGADLKPEVVGLWVGNTWEPGALTLPHQDEYAETMRVLLIEGHIYNRKGYAYCDGVKRKVPFNAVDNFLVLVQRWGIQVVRSPSISHTAARMVSVAEGWLSTADKNPVIMLPKAPAAQLRTLMTFPGMGIKTALKQAERHETLRFALQAYLHNSFHGLGVKHFQRIKEYLDAPILSQKKRGD